jgi:hypothetical protein
MADVAIRGCRSVTELYCEALATLGLVNRVRELRLFIRHDPSLADVRGRVQMDPVRGGSRLGHLSVPSDFTLRTPQLSAQMLLEAVHGLVSRLAVARGWDPTVLEGCRQQALDNGLEYRWISDPKASPNRRHRARAIFRLPPDGYGRVRLEVLRPEDDTVAGSSEEALAFCTSPGFRRAARSMRWHGNDTVSMVPYDFVPAIRGGRVTLRREGEEWRGDVEEYMTVRPVPDGDSALRALRVHVEGRARPRPSRAQDRFHRRRSHRDPTDRPLPRRLHRRDVTTRRPGRAGVVAGRRSPDARGRDRLRRRSGTGSQPPRRTPVAGLRRPSRLLASGR